MEPDSPKGTTEVSKLTRYWPLTKRGTGSRTVSREAIPTADNSTAEWEQGQGLEIIGPKEARLPAITRAVGPVKLAPPRSYFKRQLGITYAADVIDICNAVLQNEGEEELHRLLADSKGEDMLVGDALREKLLKQFAIPRLLVDAVKDVQKQGAKYGTAYAAATQLVKNKLLIQAGTTLHPKTGKESPTYVDAATQIATAAASTLSAQPGSASEEQHRKPNTTVKAPAAKARPQTNAPVQLMTGALQMTSNNEPDVRHISSILIRCKVEHYLEIRELSPTNRTALVRLAKVLTDPELDRCGPAAIKPDGQQAGGLAQHEKANSDARVQLMTGVFQMTADNEPDVPQLCSILIRRKVEHYLEIRELSPTDLTALVRLAKVITNPELDRCEPAAIKPDGQQAGGLAQHEKAADVQWQQSA